MIKKTFFGGSFKKAFVGLALIVALVGISVPLSASASTVGELQAQIAILLEQITNLQSQLNTVTTTVASDSTVCPYTWSTNLTVGNSGVDVLNLQKALNTDPATEVASSGVGSIGNETEYFGSLTKAAVIKFQDKYASEVLNPIGLTSGTGYFGTMTRNKLNELHSVCTATETEETTEDTEVIVEGTSVTANNPTSTHITKNASNFKILEVQFDGNDEINSLTVKRIGYSTRNEFKRIYLYVDGVRLNNGKTFSSLDTAVFNNLNLQAPFTLGVVVDLNGQQGNIAKVELSGDFDSSPIQSNDFTFISINSGEITVSNSFSPETVVVGQSNAQIAEFKISNSEQEDVVITQIGLRNDGHDILSNVRITDGDNTWSGSVINGNLVFDIDSYIEEGKNETYEVYADVDGYDTDTISLYVRNSYDIQATGKQYGFGVTVINDFNTPSAPVTLDSIGNIDVRSKSTDDILAYWGQSVNDVAKFRFEADESEGFYIDELHFASSTPLASTTESISITYKTKNGNTVTKTEDVEEDEDVVFDSFSSSVRPYVAKDSYMDVYVGLTLKNDDDTVNLNEERIIELYKYIATGVSSNEETDDIIANKVMKDVISTSAATITLSEEGTVVLYPVDDIEFSITFNSDDRTSAFATSTGGIVLKFNHSTTSETSLIGDLQAEVYANDTLVSTIDILPGTASTTVYLTTDEEGVLEVNDGDTIDIRIEFVGEDTIYFSSDDKDRLSVVITDTDNQITWIDNYDEDETYVVAGNIKDMTNGLPLKFIYKD